MTVVRCIRCNLIPWHFCAAESFIALTLLVRQQNGHLDVKSSATRVCFLTIGLIWNNHRTVGWLCNQRECVMSC